MCSAGWMLAVNAGSLLEAVLAGRAIKIPALAKSLTFIDLSDCPWMADSLNGRQEAGVADHGALTANILTLSTRRKRRRCSFFGKHLWGTKTDHTNLVQFGVLLPRLEVKDLLSNPDFSVILDKMPHFSGPQFPFLESKLRLSDFNSSLLFS